MTNCCSGSSAAIQTPDPNKRVNYTFGLVLGVDEFVQEQTYFLEKHNRHNRLLHGYGTIAGLSVTTDTSTGVTQIQISPGAAVNPIGQDICVPSQMCCAIETWLAQSSADLKAIFGAGPFPLDLDVCVVLCYRECPADAVPVAGEPCRTQDNAMAASRIADSFELKLCLNATSEGWKQLEAGSPSVTIPSDVSICLYRPSQIEELAAREFGAILDRIQITSEADQYLNAADFENLLLAIPNQAAAADATPDLTVEPEPAIPPEPLYLEPATARSIIQGGLRTWVTRIRPQLLNAAPGAACDIPPEKCILLADLTVPVNTNFGLAGAVTVDESRRPWLLDTRLLQEMLLSKPELENSREMRTFVTAYVVPPRTIRLWIHYPQPLTIPAAAITLTQVDAANTPIAFALSALFPGANVFDLTLPADIAAGAQYEIAFDSEQIQDSSPPRPLSEALIDPAYNYIDRYGHLLIGYTEYAFDPIQRGDAAGGDLSGTYPNPVVVGIQGNSVVPGTPNNNQVLTWNSGASQWQPANAQTAGPAGGDLSGTYPNPTVVRIQTQPVSATNPNLNQVLTWNGGAWQAANPPASGATGPAGGDLSGTYPNPSVVRIQGNSVAPGTPANNQVLTWNSGASQWQAGNAQIAGPAGGDLQGNYPNPGVRNIQGNFVLPGVPANDGDLLVWNRGATRWEPRSGPFVQAPAGPYAIVAAGLFRALGNVGPVYNGLALSSAAGNLSGIVTLRFNGYQPPTAAFTYIVKALQASFGDPQTGVVSIQFLRFTTAGIDISVTPGATGIMLEVSRIG